MSRSILKIFRYVKYLLFSQLWYYETLNHMYIKEAVVKISLRNHIGNTDFWVQVFLVCRVVCFCYFVVFADWACVITPCSLLGVFLFAVFCISLLSFIQKAKTFVIIFHQLIVLHSQSSSWSWEHFYSLHIPISDLWGFATLFHFCFWLIHFSMTFRKKSLFAAGSVVFGHSDHLSETYKGINWAFK